MTPVRQPKSKAEQDVEPDMQTSNIQRDVYGHNKIGVLIADRSGLINYANRAAVVYSGLQMKDLLGHKLTDIYKIPWEENSKLLEHEEFADQEFIVGDGADERWVLISREVRSDEDKGFEMHVFIRDISRIKKRQRLFSYLNQAANELAKARDTDTALDHIARFIVPTFADWFTIDLLKENGLELLLVQHEDPAKIEWARQYRQNYPPDPNGNSGSAAVLRSGKPAMISQITDEMVSASVTDPEQLKAVRQIGLESIIITPLFTKETVTGMVNFISSKKGRYFDDMDLEFAQQFANLMALALENARLNDDAANEIARRKQSEERFRFLTDAIPHKLWTSGPDGRAIHYNQQWHDYTGIQGFENLREKIWDLIHPDDRAIAAIEWPRAIESGMEMEMEQRLKRSDGEYRWHLTRLTVHKNDAGQTVLWVGTSTDIHEQKISGIALAAANTALSAANQELAAANEEQVMVNEELRQAQENLKQTITELAVSDSRFRSLIQDAPVAIATLKGRELIIESANDVILKRWGKSREVIGMPLALALPEFKTQPYLEILGEVFSSGRTYTESEAQVFLEHDGVLKEFFVHLTYQAVRDNFEKVIGILVVATDVTERVRARTIIEENEKRFRFLLNAIPQQVWTATPDGQLDYVNDVVCKDFGFTTHEIVGLGWQKFIHPDDLSTCLEKWSQSLLSGKEYIVEFRLLFHDRNYHWHLAKAVPMTEDGKIKLWVGTNTDIELQKSKEERKDEFLSIASHELRTPLTNIKAFNQLLQKVKDPEKLKPFVSKSSEHVNRLERLINDLLDVTKINSGKMLYNMEPFDFGKMLSDTVESARLLGQKHELILDNQVDIRYTGDHFRLEQVINNFLSNAIKYSPAGKKVIIRSKVDEGNIIVSVQDFGIGIAQENLDRLFDRYYRVDNTAMRFEGLGLGLFISSEILKRHKGSFWIESALGEGSTFYFRLPLSEAEEPKPLTYSATGYHDSTVIINYNQDKNRLDVDWTGYQDLKSVQNGCMKMLEIMKNNKVHKIVNDNTHVLGSWSEAVEWTGNIWFPMMQVAGLKYFALIYSPSVFSQLSAKKSIDVGIGNIIAQYFTDIILAEEWIDSCV